jgi:uncharacterized protein
LQVLRRASPVRTCVGCRSRAPSSELLRVVAVGDATDGSVTEPSGRETGAAVYVMPDPKRRRQGRGAHIHPDLTCLAQAERRRAFGRALRVTGVIDTGPLSEFVTAR